MTDAETEGYGYGRGNGRGDGDGYDSGYDSGYGYVDGKGFVAEAVWCKLLTAADSFFGPQGYALLVPQAYLALARLYADANAFNQPGFVKTSANDFWTTMRPSAAQEIREKGLNDWWRRTHKRDADTTPSDLFIAIMEFLRWGKLPMIRNGEMVEIAGVIQVSAFAFSESTKGLHEIHWRFNPSMERLITDSDGDHDCGYGYGNGYGRGDDEGWGDDDD